MASRKNLKKGIREIADFLLDDLFILFYVLEEKQHSKVEALLDRTMMITATSILLISHPNGAKNPKLVKQYYADLKMKFNDEIEAIEKEMAILLEQTEQE